MSVDWLKASVDQRKALYRVARAVAETTETDILGVIKEAEGADNQRGLGYATNFNHGTISRKLAKVIADWVQENHRDLAHETEPEIFPVALSTMWGEYLEANGITGQLTIRTKSRSRDLVEFEKDAAPGHHVLALGEPFTLELEQSRPGYCMGYQIYRHKWHPFPLNKATGYVETAGTRITMPQQKDGSPAHMIERQHDDKHRFAIVVADHPHVDFISKEPAAHDANSFEVHSVAVEFRVHG